MTPTRAWSEDRIEALLEKTSRLPTSSERIEAVSSEFLGTPYVPHTLEAKPGEPERLVVRLDAVDCFTLLDYVEAMRTSRSFDEFQQTLREVRYRGGVVGRETRNHFFSDWKTHNAGHIQDLTEVLAGPSSRRTLKHLNRRSGGARWVEGLPGRDEEVSWIPSPLLTPDMIQKMRTGDYLGCYAEAEGLDVTHVGILIRRGGSEYLRHASSHHGKVLDEPLRDYAETKPGMIVLRPLEQD